MSILLFAGLSNTHLILFVICLLAVCAFETINGFHDTANAVATVIYTKSLKPIHAVVWSGVWNFLGAMLGGIAVAMGIVKLMPLNDLAAQPLGENIALVLAILISAIIWNLGTWYFGIPCSSSHTLIGSLLGAGFAFWQVHGGDGPNWSKAQEIGLSLLLSPVVGFSLAILLMFLLRNWVKNKIIFKEPDPKKAPPLWIRAILIGTCTLVSFFHGNNDGQKGVGLLLVVMMAFLPLQFALNPELPLADMKNRSTWIAGLATQEAAVDPEHANSLLALAGKATALSAKIDSTNVQDKKSLFTTRQGIQKLNKEVESALDNRYFSAATAKNIESQRAELAKAYEFSPIWVVFLISLCLGLGTMVGWKRIVVTIGEKIGKSHLTYAQGASAEVCAAVTIGMSSSFGLPVSTTHVLSSGIAGTMVAQGGVKNLQKKTITNIAIAWLLTLPVTFVMGMLLYFFFRAFA
jgi:inorganic phosphate transporter, PiT family